ncbi:MAG: hypothetical protein BroJett013_30230 [Alphaproteobacteria bacterium]|nr:MAG: hypothetical protein BroJett013_30230 [Alphaproteobacteria bacterium]
MSIIVPGRRYSIDQVYTIAENSFHDHAVAMAGHMEITRLNAASLLVGAGVLMIARTADAARTRAFLMCLADVAAAGGDALKVEAAQAALNTALHALLATERQA